jgi:hypothetical protein
MAAAAVAAAMVRPPLPPHGTPPLIYGRGVPLNPPGAAVAADPLALNPFGPLPVEPLTVGAAAATAAVAGGSAAAAAAVGVSPDTQQQQQQQQQYLGSSSMSSLDGSYSIGGQWPAGEVSSSGGGRSGCPVYVMLPLDTVWVVEREDKKVGGAAWRMGLVLRGRVAKVLRVAEAANQCCASSQPVHC